MQTAYEGERVESPELRSAPGCLPEAVARDG